MIKSIFKFTLLAATASLAFAGAASAGKLTIESWRNDDAAIWKDKIIPAFNAKHPDIQVEFSPTAPKEYNASLNARLEGGTAGDIITCRPFDASLELFNKGRLAGLNDLASMANFSDVAKAPGRQTMARQHSACPWARLFTALFTTRTFSRNWD
jgi:raffinose/stachyose/melibiose transport system substrate-binding protein